VSSEQSKTGSLVPLFFFLCSLLIAPCSLLTPHFQPEVGKLIARLIFPLTRKPGILS
jgi:hypothetical protein